MKIEKIRNNHKKEIIIGTILTVVIGGALTYKITHSKYRVTQSIDLGSGVINYAVPDFKIMAMYQQKDGSTCTDDSCYNELTGRMPSSGYVINTSKSYCNLNGNKDNNVVIENVNGKPLFSGLNKGDKCYLYFDKKITIDNIIASLNAKTSTPDFSQVATSDEGVYSTSDGINMYSGTTYYWRGAASTNYVKFAGFCWRIIRINGDKTIRMIYDGSTCHANGTSTEESLAVTSQAYNLSKDQSNYVGWTYSGELQRTTGGTNSNAKSQTESWYNSHIGNNAAYSAKVADGKFCNDRNAGSAQSWVLTGKNFEYATYVRSYKYNPTFNCNNAGDVYTLKVGAIAVDELAFAGGVYNKNNKSYYLYNGQKYWTMSPREWDTFSVSVIFMGVSGQIDWNGGATISTYGLRPVINLKSDTTFSSGNGTFSQPYIVN